MRRFCLCASALALLSLPMMAAGATLPVKQWVRFPEARNVVISPDGKHLAVISSPKHSDKYQLVVFDTKQVVAGHPKVKAHLGLREYEQFAGIRWVNNNRLIAWTARKRGGFNRPNLDGKLFAVNADGTRQKKLLPNNNGWFGGIVSLLRSHSRDILVSMLSGRSNHPWVYRLDVYTGSTVKVAQSPVAGGGLLADHAGHVRVAWGVNTKSGKPEVYYRPAGQLDWKEKPGLVNNLPKAAAALATGGPIMFGPHNQSVYYETWSHDAAETMGLYRINVKTWKSKPVFVSKKVDVGIGDFPVVSPFITSLNHRSLVGLRTMPGKVETRAIDVKSPRIQLLAGLQQALPGKQVVITSHTKDGSEAVVKVWGDTTPARYFLYTSKPKPSLSPLLSSTPWIKAKDLSPMRPITYKARDGLTIHGYLTVPRGKKAKNLPLVVYVHGGPHGIRYDWGFDATDFDLQATQILANHGYAVLAPNYRGSGGYGFKFEEAGFRHWGSTMQDDLADAVKWAVKQGIANPHRICILGASYGGYASLMSAERFPDMFQCAVGYDGAYDLTVQESRASDTDRSASGRLYLRTVLGNNTKQLKAFSPVYNVGTLKAPVLLLHGGRDQRTPVKGFHEMVHAIHEHGTPLETLFEKNEGHGFYKPAHQRKAWTTILAFLDKHIGPRAGNGKKSD